MACLKKKDRLYWKQMKLCGKTKIKSILLVIESISLMLYPLPRIFFTIMVYWYYGIDAKHSLPHVLKQEYRSVLCLLMSRHILSHYSDVIMGAMASQITGVLAVYSTVCSGVDQRKHQQLYIYIYIYIYIGSHPIRFWQWLIYSLEISFCDHKYAIRNV